jgi:hypothetical protein
VQVVTNEARARNELRKGNALLFASMGLFLVGMAQTCQGSASAEADALTTAMLVLSMAALLSALPFINRWGPRFRQDGPLEKALKGLDNRYTLLNFVGGKLPDHLLIGPGGVRVLVARGMPGVVRCRRDRWSRPGTLSWLGVFSGDALRDPTAEAARGVARVTGRLASTPDMGLAADAPVGATIVFTNPKTSLELDGSRFPVTRARELRAHVQRDKGALRPPEVVRLRQALEPTASRPAG